MEPKKTQGIVTKDPALELVAGERLNFQAYCFEHHSLHNSVWLQDWETLDGLLLNVHFTRHDQHSVEGSAVMVGPGIAIGAKHVFEEYIKEFKREKRALGVSSLTREGLKFWQVTQLIMLADCDLCIITLSYASSLPQGNVFNQAALSTRLPKEGELLSIVGFKASEYSYPRDGTLNMSLIKGDVIVCSGRVTTRYPTGRDRAMLPGPVLEVDCPTWGGMSGGPVFDSKGMLIGILSSSYDEGPSYVSLLWPALTKRFVGGWPNCSFTSSRSLIEMAPLCRIDNPTAFNISIDDATGEEKIEYLVWE